jgi:hypothetical protein
MLILHFLFFIENCNALATKNHPNARVIRIMVTAHRAEMRML